jgi:hypothetical protein
MPSLELGLYVRIACVICVRIRVLLLYHQRVRRAVCEDGYLMQVRLERLHRLGLSKLELWFFLGC